MNRKKKISLLAILILLTVGIYAFTRLKSDNDSFISYKVDLQKQNLKLYWKNDKNEPFQSLGNLKNWLAKNKQTLVFAMNAGMYTTDNSPLGLFIQDKKTITTINKRSGDGNFYLKPNGVFYTTTDNIATICKTENFVANSKIKYATQSGPMLVSMDKFIRTLSQVQKI